VVMAAVAVAACFSPVGETQCSTDADCMGGRTCIDFRCRVPDAGAATGGGSATGAGGAAGGGSIETGGGQSGGAPATGGGAACGCKGGNGTCFPGDSPFNCGANGAMCQRCGMGEQCVNGACVMAACGPGTCTGCCAQGVCLTAANQNGLGCGSGGVMCARCPNGQTCVNGTCAQPPPCNSMTCASGCCVSIPGTPGETCLQVDRQNQLACGTGGAMCRNCMGGSCTNGTCSAPVMCNAQTCPTGCCFQNQCVTQQSNLACGTAAAMCQQCMRGTVCQAGACVPNTPTDGGAPVGLPAGSACTNNGPPCDGFCLPEQMSGYPGGYCTGTCSAMQPCVSGVCVSESVFGMTVSSCRSACAAPGTGQSTCRTGYVCTAVSPGSTMGFCRPDCNKGQLASCTSGQCQSNGYCM
jgi:hypothetical protein